MRSNSDTPDPRRRIWQVASVLFFLLVVSILATRAKLKTHRPGEIDDSKWAFQDFRDAIYYPGCSIRSGHDPYDTADHMQRYPVGQLFPLYSPLTLLIHQPFSWLPYEIARWVYFGFSLVLTVLLVRVIYLTLDRVPRWEMLLFWSALMLMSRPGQMNLLLGQSTLQLVLASMLALHWSSRRPKWAGLMLALTTFKPTYGCLIFFFLLARRKYSAAGYGLLIGCLLTIPLFAYLFWLEGGPLPFIEVLKQTSEVFDQHEGRNPLSSFGRIDGYLLFCKLFRWSGNAASEFSFAGLILAISAGVIAWSSKNFKKDQESLLQAGILISVIVAIYHHAYDWLLLAPIVGWLFATRKPMKSQQQIGRRWLLFLLLIPAFNYLSTNTFRFFLEDQVVVWRVITSANAMAMLGSWLILMAMLIRRKDHHPDSLD